ALSVAAECLRLQTRCPFHFGKELADRCIPGSDFDWKRRFGFEFGESCRPALYDQRQINVPRFGRRFLLVAALQVKTLADAAEMNSHRPLGYFVRLSVVGVRPMFQPRL